ncbi:hypothetical protein ACH5RR_003625 [Cinchona calisaya]|uniref:Uncharacterized protein n=1 Tax=Cinchona calisaya TaxID=153742 RepID=A0ABD3AVE0_9GENT
MAMLMGDAGGGPSMFGGSSGGWKWETLCCIYISKVFQVDSNVESVLRELLRIKRHLRIISDRYRTFILFTLIISTRSQFASPLMSTRSTADLIMYRTGELAVCILT